MTYNKIYVSFGALRKITGPALQWRYNEKQYLIVKGIDLPEFYEVDFCNKGDTTTITMPSTAEGALIPDQFLLTGKPLVAYIVVIDGESVNTVAEITFPVNARGARTDISPESAEQQQINALIALLNQAVSESQASEEEAERQAGISGEYASDSEAWAVGQRNGTDVEPADETYQNNAKYYSELAAQHAEESGYAWFDVHDDDGHMYVYISDNLSEDVSFAINETTGHLEVTYN